MHRILPLILSIVCFGLSSAPPRPAPQGGVSDLERDLYGHVGDASTRPGGIHRAAISSTVLSHPIESSGELRYDAPDRLEKRTLKPRVETLVLAAGVLTVERAGRRRVMDLHAYPQALPFVESIRATLAGDRTALERLFHLDFAGSVSRWTLTLVPLESKVKQSVSQVRIDGIRDQLLKVEIRQPDGDRSLMTLRPSTLPP